jgi:hypothetical protein
MYPHGKTNRNTKRSQTSPRGWVRTPSRPSTGLKIQCPGGKIYRSPVLGQRISTLGSSPQKGNNCRPSWASTQTRGQIPGPPGMDSNPSKRAKFSGGRCNFSRNLPRIYCHLDPRYYPGTSLGENPTTKPWPFGRIAEGTQSTRPARIGRILGVFQGK